MNEDRGWYSDRELFEMIQGLKNDLTETRMAIKKYNGLWEKFNNVDHRLIAIEQQAIGRFNVGKAIREWGGWILAILTLIISLKSGGLL